MVRILTHLHSSTIFLEVLLGGRSFTHAQVGSPLLNGNLDQGSSSWNKEMWDPSRGTTLTWDSAVGVNGSGGFLVQTASQDLPNDARWYQTVYGLTPGAQYRVTAKLRLDDYAWAEGNTYECGASISRIDTFDHSECLNEANPGVWQPAELVFTAAQTSEKIGCRLGYFSSIVSGLLYCDDFAMEEIGAVQEGPPPSTTTPQETPQEESQDDFFQPPPDPFDPEQKPFFDPDDWLCPSDHIAMNECQQRHGCTDECMESFTKGCCGFDALGSRTMCTTNKKYCRVLKNCCPDCVKEGEAVMECAVVGLCSFNCGRVNVKSGNSPQGFHHRGLWIVSMLVFSLGLI